MSQCLGHLSQSDAAVLRHMRESKLIFCGSRSEPMVNGESLLTVLRRNSTIGALQSNMGAALI